MTSYLVKGKTTSAPLAQTAPNGGNVSENAYIPLAGNSERKRIDTQKIGTNFGNFRMGTVWLDIPPSQINISEFKNNIKIQTLRTNSSMKFSSGRSMLQVNLDVFFNGEQVINGKLRSLLAQLKSYPFIELENELIRSAVESHEQKIEWIKENRTTQTSLGQRENELLEPGVKEFIMSNMPTKLVFCLNQVSVRTVEDFPETLHCNFSFVLFNYFPFGNFLYLANDNSPTSDILKCDRFIDHYYKRFLLSYGNPKYLKHYKAKEDSLEFQYVTSIRNMKEGVDKNQDFNTNNYRRYPSKKAGFVDIGKKYKIKIVKNEKSVISAITVGLRNIITTIPVLGYDFPTIQYLGSRDDVLRIQIQTSDRNLIEDIKRMSEAVGNLARGRIKRHRENYVEIENNFVNMLGLRDVLLESFEVSTVPNQPELTVINLTFVEYDITQADREVLTLNQARTSSDAKRKILIEWAYENKGDDPGKELWERLLRRLNLIRRFLTETDLRKLSREEEREIHNARRSTLARLLMQGKHSWLYQRLRNEAAGHLDQIIIQYRASYPGLSERLFEVFGKDDSGKKKSFYPDLSLEYGIQDPDFFLYKPSVKSAIFDLQIQHSIQNLMVRDMEAGRAITELYKDKIPAMLGVYHRPREEVVRETRNRLASDTGGGQNLVGGRTDHQKEGIVRANITEGVEVLEIKDGDTIKVGIRQDGGVKEEWVRYHGIDAPELDANARGERRRARLALQANKALVLGKSVELEFDIQERDKYGRLLAWVFVNENGNRVLVNERLVADGHAKARPRNHNLKHIMQVIKAEKDPSFMQPMGLFDSKQISSDELNKFHRHGMVRNKRFLSEALANVDDDISRMNRAFPTFALYFIEEDAEHWRRFDDFYGYSSVQSIDIIRSRKIPIDTAIVKVTNIRGNLDNQNFFSKKKGPKEDQWGPENNTPEEQDLDSFVMQPGTKIQIRLGYNNNEDIKFYKIENGLKIESHPDNFNHIEEGLPVVFNGIVTELTGGEFITFVAQSYAVELFNPINPRHINPTAFGMVKRVLYDEIKNSGTRNFGRWSLFDKKEKGDKARTFFGIPTTSPIHANILRNIEKGWFKYYISDSLGAFLARRYATGALLGWWTQRTFYSREHFWRIADDFVSTMPGYIMAATPYDHRMTFFVGEPEDNYFFTDRLDDSKYLKGLRGVRAEKRELTRRMSVLLKGRASWANRRVFLKHLEERYGLSGENNVFAYLQANYMTKDFSNKVTKQNTKQIIDVLVSWGEVGKGFAGRKAKSMQWLQEQVIGVHHRHHLTQPRFKRALRTRLLIKAMLLEVDRPAIDFDNRMLDIERRLKNPREKPFRNFFFLSDTSHIVANNIKANMGGNFANSVIVGGNRSRHDLTGTRAPGFLFRPIKADDDIKEDNIKTKVHIRRLVTTKRMVFNFGLVHLANHLRDMYKGELVILGNPRIKDRDICYLYDRHTDMWGPMEVEQVVHHFSQETGFISTITPDLSVSIGGYLSEAYKYAAYVTGGCIMAAGARGAVKSYQAAAATAGVAKGAAATGTAVTAKGVAAALAATAWSPLTWIATAVIAGGYGVILLYNRFSHLVHGRREPISFDPLIYGNKPYVAGVKGFNKNNIWGHIATEAGEVREGWRRLLEVWRTIL